jgi:two-component system sensor histidine kinase KdpD
MHDASIGALAVAAASDEVSLEESERLSRVLLYSLSHDLRTPVTAITTIAAALRSATVEAGVRDAMLADLETEADRLVRLLSNLLDASRVEAGVLRPTLARVPVDELCLAAVEDARPSLGTRLVEVAVEPQLMPVEVDETMIHQALVNLLENAARHDPGPLEVRAARVRRFLEIRVIDHGPGVPAAERERIFEAFRRLCDQARERPRGTGLGLAIARGFVEAHRGDVHVEPTPGGGATFVVSLPIR